jgi:hypothetical protein
MGATMPTLVTSRASERAAMPVLSLSIGVTISDKDSGSGR